jgi:phenylalanyl-tRNA synthetase alpha chain
MVCRIRALMSVLSTLARLHCITFCLFISSTLTLFALDAGLVCDRGLTLGDLIGVLNDFFSRLGIKKLRFKPAYNPYTEPSMEIFSYHETLKKWVEVGNSGMFRPEMLQPMGLPADVSVIAWGLSLER